MIITSKEEHEILRESGRRLARIRDLVSAMVAPGVSTKTLDEEAERLILDGGDVPAFLNYTPSESARPYPATLCVSVNDEVVHGVPNENPYILNEGDIVGLDIGLAHRGIITDTAVTVAVGKIDPEAKKLMDVTQKALKAGIKAAKAGNHVGDIGAAIEKSVGNRYSIVRELGGHGVGKNVHEDPFIPNFGTPGTGAELVSGMVLALEPMLNEGSEGVKLAPDGFTFKTVDGKLSAHFEHTILVTDGEAEVITKP